MNRTSVRWNWALVVCIASTLAAQAPSPVVRANASPPAAISASPQKPIVDAQAFRGQGRLAIVWSHRLYVLDGRAGRLRQVAPSGIVAAAVWSADGRWLAYLRPPSPGELWIVDVDTGQSRRVHDASQTVPPGGFAWSPTASVLAVLTRSSTGASQLLLVHPRGDLQRLPTVVEAISSFDWSPDGRMLAYVTTNRSTSSPHDVVKTMPTTGGPSVSRFEAPALTGVKVAGWWPNGKGLLFWLLPSYSQSLAADGLRLYSLPFGSGKPRPLATTLPYRDWLSWAPGGRRLILVEGSGRQVWKGKFLTVCDAEIGTCRRLRQRSDAVSLDPAWSPDGPAIAFVRTRALSGLPPAAEVAKWMDTRTLWLAAPDGTNTQEVVRAGRGVVGPMWSTNRRDLLFWRDEALWLLNTKTDAVVKLVGPFPAGPALSSFYGHVSWRDLVSWHRP